MRVCIKRIEESRIEGREGLRGGGRTLGIQHLLDGAGDAGGVAGEDELEAVVGDEGYVAGGGGGHCVVVLLCCCCVVGGGGGLVW